MIDTESLKAHIQFAIQHHGTRTQGEEYRAAQVADHLTELFQKLMIADRAMMAALEHSEHVTSLSIKVG